MLDDLRTRARDSFGVEDLNQARDDTESRAYGQGLITGIRRFAWWKDGVQYVGSCGKTLKEALAEAAKEAT